MSGNKNIAQRKRGRRAHFSLPGRERSSLLLSDFVIIPFRFGHPNIQEFRSLLSTFLNGGLRRERERERERVGHFTDISAQKAREGVVEIRSILRGIVAAAALKGVK